MTLETGNTTVRTDNRQETYVTRGEWIALAAFVVSLATTVFQIGVVYSEVQNHERRLVVVETSGDELERRIERIDANVAFLAELAREERNR